MTDSGDRDPLAIRHYCVPCTVSWRSATSAGCWVCGLPGVLGRAGNAEPAGWPKTSEAPRPVEPSR